MTPSAIKSSHAMTRCLGKAAAAGTCLQRRPYYTLCRRAVLTPVPFLMCLCSSLSWWRRSILCPPRPPSPNYWRCQPITISNTVRQRTPPPPTLARQSPPSLPEPVYPRRTMCHECMPIRAHCTIAPHLCAVVCQVGPPRTLGRSGSGYLGSGMLD